MSMEAAPDVAALRAQLEAARTTIEALTRGQIDAVVREGEGAVLLREAQEQLRRSEALFRGVFEGAQDAMLIADDQHRLVDVNPAACALFGASRDVLLRSEPTRPDELSTTWQDLFRKGVFRGEYTLRRADGSTRVLDALVTGGILPGLHLAVLRDITEQHRLARALAFERDRLGALFEQAPGIVTVLRGPDLVIELANQECKRLLGDRALVDRPLSEAVPELVGPSGPLENIQRVLATGEPFRQDGYPLQLLRDGEKTETRYIDWICQPLVEEDGRRSGVIVHGIDATERVRLDEHLRRVQKMEAIGRLAGGVAHDFNNLLTIIRSYANVLIDSLDAQAPMVAELREICTAADRAASLTRQLLTLGRRQAFEPRPLDLVEQLRANENMLRRALGEDILLSMELEPCASIVLADPTQVDQVVMNLALNARDAMPNGGKLRIALANETVGAPTPADRPGVPPGDWVVLTVRDAGVGMDAATKSRIFEPFFTTKEHGKGTGLGLPTVFGIVHQLGGHIFVESEPGRGATFRIYLPCAEEPAAPTSAGMEGAEPRGTEVVLLVEDDDQVRALTSSVLRRLGYQVLEAQNAGDALLVSEQFKDRIHLLLTDVVMPRLSGRALADRLSAQRPDLKVLFMSGYADEALHRHGVGTTSRTLLEKPFTPASLARQVRAVLDG